MEYYGASNDRDQLAADADPNGGGIHDFHHSPTLPGGDNIGEASSSAAVVVESIVEQVVTFIACKSDINKDGCTDCEYEKESVEDVIRLMLSGTAGPTLAPLSPISGDESFENDRGNVVNISLDEQGNYLPPVNSTGPGSSGSSSNDNLIDFGIEEGCKRQDSTGTSAGGTTEPDDATNVLLLLQILVDENKALRRENAKLKKVMQFVMSKYRNSMSFLLNELDIYRNDFQKIVNILEEKAQNFDPNMEVFKLNSVVAEMKHVMFEAARFEDDTANLYEEKIAQLGYENQGLRKLMRIALEFGNGQLRTYADKVVQTEDSLERVNDGYDDADEVAGTIVKRGESLDVYAPSYEIEEDLDSFHSAADSLNGSTISLNQEPDGTSDALPIGETELALSPILVATVGDQDKVEFDAENVNNVLMEVTLKNE